MPVELGATDYERLVACGKAVASNGIEVEEMYIDSVGAP